ncbi:uncharacterized protein [Clytia hemisphaerica]|uniref:Uncharacterized protein n=1 Tax=Clytia hemisphaerica TaxID=252671 RepID=A0A7M5UW21_9CNID
MKFIIGERVRLVTRQGDGLWVKRICRVCGVQDPPRSLFPDAPDMTDWVDCKKCSPKRWFHLLCLGTKEHDPLYHCDDKKVKVTKSLVLESGDLVLKRRKNKQIKKCGAKDCKNKPINTLPLASPHNLIFMKKEKRLKRDERKATAKEDSYVLSNVHYHVDRSCTGDSTSIFVSDDVDVTLSEKKHLEDNGFHI